MKADNIDHFEVVLRNFDYDDLMNWVDLSRWIVENCIKCTFVNVNTCIVTGCDDATLMKLRWG
jgi:hypothetical protein